MDHDEAKLRLSLCQPGIKEDLEDSLIVQAFSMTKSDATLRDWFEREQSEDAHICVAIEQIRMPSDLRTNILSGMRAHKNSDSNKAPQRSESDDKKSLFPAPKAKHRNIWIGIAAILSVLLTISIIQQNRKVPEPVSIAALEIPPVIHFLANEIKTFQRWDFDKQSETFKDLQGHLVANRSPFPVSIPKFAQSLPTIGCAVFEFNGNKLSMICFRGSQVYHLITIENPTFRDPLFQTPKIFETQGQAFKAWQDDGKFYILGVEGPKETLPRFI